MSLHARVLMFGVAVAMVATAGCESGTRPRKEVVEDDTPDPEDLLPVVTVVGNPTSKTMSDALPGSTTIKIQLKDPAKTGFAEAKVEYVETGAGSGKKLDSKTPGELGGKNNDTVDVEFELVTKDIAWAHGELLFTATTTDFRTATARIEVFIDNAAPVITAGPEVPVDGGLFSTDLDLHFEVTDNDQTGVRWVEVTCEGCKDASMLPWTYAGCDDGSCPAAKPLVNTFDAPALVVSTTGWGVTEVTVTVKARDVVGNEAASQTFHWTFVPAPHFLVGERAPLPQGVAGVAVASILLQGDTPTPAVLVASTTGVQAYTRADVDQVEVRTSISTVSTTAIQVADMDGDEIDDVIALTADNKVTIHFQDATGAFAACAADRGCVIAPEQTVNAFAVGDLNEDERPDFALALNADVHSLGLVLSKVEDDVTSWGSLAAYGGVKNPTLVAIGRFTPDEDHEPLAHALLAKAGSSVVTRFPVDAATGVPTGGEDNHLSPNPTEMTGFTYLTATAIKHDGAGYGSSALLTDSSNQSLSVLGEAKRKAAGIETVAFEVRKQLPTGVTPVKSVAGDIDQDGYLDVAVLSRGSNMVQVFWGKKFTDVDQDYEPDGDSVLYEGPAMLTLSEARDVALADMDGDQKLDIVVLDDSGKNLSIMAFRPKGGGVKGVFEARRMYRMPCAYKVVSIAGGRFATDPAKKWKDVAVLAVETVENVQKTVVKLLTADPDWNVPVKDVSPEPVIALDSPEGLIAANLDSYEGATNPYDDLIITSNNVGPAPKGTLGIVRYTGGGVFVAPTTFYAGDAPKIVATADLDYATAKDPTYGSVKGAFDIAVIASFPLAGGDPGQKEYRLQTFVGNGKGVFKPTPTGVPVNENDQPRVLRAAKIQGSPYPDLVVGFGATPEFSVFYSNAGALFFPTETRIGLGGQTLLDLAPDKLDGPPEKDPMTDVVGLLDAGLTISWASGEPDATVAHKGSNVSWSTSTVPFALPATGAAQLEIADMNKDGYKDLVVLFSAQNLVAIYPNLGPHQFAAPIVLQTGVHPKQMVIADFNGDGCDDIATLEAEGKSVTFLRTSLCVAAGS
jgi:hypothetical protein